MSVRRKLEHLNVSLKHDVVAEQEAGWSDVHLPHECLPEIDPDEIDLKVGFCGRIFRYPLMISAITGGGAEAAAINEDLARAAEQFGIGMEIGSQAVLMDSPEMEYSYTVARKAAPNAFMAANIGVSRLIEQQGRIACSLEQIRWFVDLIRADALVIHLNFLQESVMPEGDTRARGCLDAIRRVVEGVAVPVIVKETGAGISRRQAVPLRESGVAVLDIGGAGGTSMALVESHRAGINKNQKYKSLGATFAHWGIPTVVSLIETRNLSLPVIASGGIHNGLEAARALALGASLVGVARPLLQAAVKGYEAVAEWLDVFFSELRTTMFLSSASSLADLQKKRPIILGTTREWLEALGYDANVI